MAWLLWVGVGCVFAGAMVFSIGGMVSFKRNYAAHNRSALALWNGKDIVDAQTGLLRAQWADPKTRLWMGIGMSLWLSGMAIIIILVAI
jgi:hypothetical protein